MMSWNQIVRTFLALGRDITEEGPVTAQEQLQLWRLVVLLWWYNSVGRLEPIRPSLGERTGSCRSNV